MLPESAEIKMVKDLRVWRLNCLSMGNPYVRVKEFGMRSIAWWPTVIVLAVATFTDLRSRRIPNWLVVPFLVAGIAASSWFQGWTGLGHSLEGLALGAAIYGALNLFGGMGMGDVKLVAAIGAWIGPAQLGLALVMTAMAGGLIALGWAGCWYVGKWFKSLARARTTDGQEILVPGSESAQANPLGKKMPFAPAIAIGTLISFFS